jgi:hypothetical protein
MAWISFVIVVIVFFVPPVALARIILQGQTAGWLVSLPEGMDALTISWPYNGILSLVFYSTIAWAALWLVLMIAEEVSGQDWLDRARLRNGMLYALRPAFSNRLAARLAWVVLIYYVLATIAAQLPLDAAILDAVFPFPMDAELISLCVLTVIVDLSFLQEQRTRHESELRRIQRQRKKQQLGVVARQPPV